jgi:hypothetical protein
MLEHQATEVLSNVDMLIHPEYIRESAEAVIEASAHWDSPNGRVLARGDARRIEYGNAGRLEIRYGRNKFLVEEAIRRCAELIRIAANSVLASDVAVGVFDREPLEAAVQSAVANYNESEYSGFYPAVGGYMEFGNHLIHVPSFVDWICDKSETYLLESDVS